MAFGSEVAGTVEDECATCQRDHDEEHQTNGDGSTITIRRNGEGVVHGHRRNRSTICWSVTETVRTPGVQTPVSDWLATTHDTVTVTTEPCHVPSSVGSHDSDIDGPPWHRPGRPDRSMALDAALRAWPGSAAMDAALAASCAELVTWTPA